MFVSHSRASDCKGREGRRGMTNIEKIRDMRPQELASFLCNLMCADCCRNNCPAKDYCELGHTGMKDWLESESDDAIKTGGDTYESS